MDIKIFAAAALAATSLSLTSCNDDFLEKIPKTDLTEANAFLEYNNFKAFMYPCYDLFTNTTIRTNLNGQVVSSTFYGDWYGGLVTSRDNSRNPYAYQSITQTTSGGGWDFSIIRRINIMLSHLDDGVLNETEAAHWRSVGYFFKAWWYMELIDRFGDVPWVDKVINEGSEETYGPRTPRAEVAQHIIECLEYAAQNIGNFEDGDNTITANAVKAALSRFLLREGTWAKYHGLDEPCEQYLSKCLEVSQDLMNQYSTLYNGTESYPAAGYGEMWTTEDLTNVPGVIFFKQYYDGILMHRFNDYEHIAAHFEDVPQYSVDMFLMKNGLPIANPNSGYKGGKGKDMWDTFDNRDPRLYQNIQPPYVVAANDGTADGVNSFKTWKYLGEGDVVEGHTVTAEEAAKYGRKPGQIKVKDLNNDDTIDANDDKKIVGHTRPRWTGGWSNTFSYKNFELSFFILSRWGFTVPQGAVTLDGRYMQRKIDYWVAGTNENAKYYSPGSNGEGADAFNSAMNYQDGSYIKVRNISLGYNFTPQQLKNLGINNLKLYVQAMNPFNIYKACDFLDTDLVNYDNNTKTFGSPTTLKSFVIGVNIGF